jgi:tRNA (guanine37-N1)-methyltransferase
MKISVLTIFPESFESFLATPVVKRATEKGLAEIEIVDIRSYAGGSFRHIDDSPFGGGPGMIMRCQPILEALNAVGTSQSHTVMLSPKGTRYDQKNARRFASMEHIVLLCGHYEGIDARVEPYFAEQISLGDYILTGGELAAQVVIDSVVRLLKGALRDSATADESHEKGLLEYPQFFLLLPSCTTVIIIASLFFISYRDFT